MKREQAILSIGMGPGQLEFIRRLKDRGFKVAGFGKGRNSPEAEALLDYKAELDTSDFESAKNWVDSLGVEITAVGSFAGGRAVATTQRLANYYKAPTAVPDFLLAGTDKIEQQKLYVKYGLSTIPTWRASELTPEDVQAAADKSFIVKPSVGRGSEGITIVTRAELADAVRQNSMHADTVIQGVRTGREYRCLILIQDHAIKLLAPILRKSYRDTVFLGVLKYSEQDLDRLKAFVGAFVEKTGIRSAVIKADIIVSERSIDVIEMDIGVGGGTYFKKFISRLYGTDIMDEYIDLITGKKLSGFQVKYDALRMDYVFNHSPLPIEYDLETCRRILTEKLGKCEIQINVLHPETKGGYQSNADFIFTVMYESAEPIDRFLADEIANESLFRTVPA